jgi:cobalt-precorrin 5A hydrolase
MAAGIVVRTIAGRIRHKTMDPAVVVVDELGHHAISLLSGHIGGANLLANEVAAIVGARPVITTATDLHQLPAVDVLANQAHLHIENPNTIKVIHAALLSGKKIGCHDPYGLVCNQIPDSFRVGDGSNKPNASGKKDPQTVPGGPGIFVDDKIVELPPHILILRPKTLVAGIGCNRNTPMETLKTFLYEVLQRYRLSKDSLTCLASISIKKDEAGLLALSTVLKLPLKLFNKEALKQVSCIKTPSAMVEKHVGVKSVCEAAAVLAAKHGELVVSKQSTPNVTVAVARKSFMS